MSESNFIRSLPLIRELEPFLVTTPFNARPLDKAPFGVRIPPAHVFDPLRVENEPFLGLLQTLDGRTFGPEGMPMDRWVFYDCCYMPGAIFGFGKRARDLDPRSRAILEVPADYLGLVPLAMYIAIPMASPGAWMGHNLASIGPQLEDPAYRGLGTLAKTVGLRCFRTRSFFGATQWDSKALFIHVKFGPLDLVTAYTPAHSESRTLTYAFDVTDRALMAAVGDPSCAFDRPAPDAWIHCHDDAAMIALEDRIEAGEAWVIPGPPRMESDGTMSVPIARKRAE